MPSDPVLVPRAQLPMRHPYVAPRTATEEQLAEVWREVLSMDRVGVEDDYHDLGGDSLHASIIFMMIEERFRIALPIAKLAQASTVAQLAQVIDEAVATR